MKNKTRSLITFLLVVAVTATTLFAVLRGRTGGPEPVPPAQEPDLVATVTDYSFPDAFDTCMLYVPGSSFMVYPVDFQSTVEIGQYVYFTVKMGDAFYSPSQVTYEIAQGKDCAAAYVTGSVLGLGVGDVVVKVFLDADPSVYGYCRLRVIESSAPGVLTALQQDVSAAAADDPSFEEAISGFPESYKPYLRELHAHYPAWQFHPVYTGAGFYDAVYNESAYDRNKILNWNAADLLKRKYNSDYSFGENSYYIANTGWVYASPIFVAYYMDPRNFMDEQSVMQFESLHYNEAAHTVEGIEGILRGSFMHETAADYLDTSGNRVAAEKTYAQIIFEAGVRYDINPYFLAAKIRQEIGSTPSMSATGTYEGYEGYYNFFNVGAYDGLDEIQRGLSYASGSGSYGRPWTSPETAIHGGTEFLQESYIGAGQDTGYMQKYNVNTANAYDLYTNQYMTNASGAVTQAISAYNGYKEAGLLSYPLVFNIPVFEDMPAANLPATEVHLGGSEYGIAACDVTLRAGPAAFYAPVENIQLARGSVVTVLRCVETDAQDYRSRTYYPCWYEVVVQADDIVYKGYVSEEFILRGCSRVLNTGDELALSASLVPADSDDTVRYVSENINIATVSQDGVVTAVAPGVVSIVGYTSGGAVDSYRITVTG